MAVVVKGLTVYSCTNISTLNRLAVKQKKSIRVINNAKYREHTGPLFKELRILPLTKMIELAKLKFMHKYVQDKLPLSFAETWVTNRQRNVQTNLRNADAFFIPPHQRDNFKRFPLYTFPTAWNNADENKYNPNLYTFLRSQKL